MSTLLAMENGEAVFHMTTDERSQAQLKNGAVSTTTFHSDLPYVFVRKQFEISTYTQWSGSDGGRKFSFSQDLIDYRDDNPDLAYLLIMEDSAGNSWVHDPLVHVRGKYSKTRSTWGTSGGATWRTYDKALGINGGDYLTAYTDNDTQIQDLTDQSINGSFNVTFRTWDSNDTSVTVFRIRDLHTSNSTIDHEPYSRFWRSWLEPHTLECMWDWVTPSADYDYVSPRVDLISNNLDVVKVRFVFLNVTHNASTFELQKGFAKDSINISPTDFTVHNVDLGGTRPLISHGNNASGATVSPVISGQVVSGKGVGLDLETAKINSSNQLINTAAPVLEIPPAITGSGWDMNFNTRTIKYNGTDVFSDSISANALGVIGSQEITFTPSATLTRNNNNPQTFTLSSTATGSIGNVDSDTMFLASIVNGTDKLHSTSLFGIGDNLVAQFILSDQRYHTSSFSSLMWWHSTIKIYLTISSNGSTSVKLKHAAGNNQFTAPAGTFYNNRWHANITSVSFSIEQLKIRLIAMGNLGQ